MSGHAVSHAPVTHPLMYQEWLELSFLHWRYPPEQVQRLLPAGLTVQPFEGDAWVALVPFRMRVRLPGLPAVPYATVFLETNVRTYVVGPDGQPAVWFFSLDAPRLHAVLAARATYRLPYVWSRMSMQRAGRVYEYSDKRHLGAVRSHVRVEVGDTIPPAEVDELTRFLTSRWRLITRGRGGRMIGADVDHPLWPVAEARVVALDDGLVTAAGLPPPRAEPLVLHSPGVVVRIARPRRVRG